MSVATGSAEPKVLRKSPLRQTTPSRRIEEKFVDLLGPAASWARLAAMGMHDRLRIGDASPNPRELPMEAPLVGNHETGPEGGGKGEEDGFHG